MKLQQLARKPTLLKQVIDDAEIVEKYGEPVEFYVYDRYDMNTLMRLASVEGENFSAITDIVKELVLDEEGNPVITDENSLPLDIMLKVVEATVNQLGNLANQTSAK